MTAPAHVYVTYIRTTPEQLWVALMERSPRTAQDVGQGWPWILASLKTLLETGESLPPPAAG
jgi:hypothetical protein